MPLKVHFLNVGHGDCTLVEFPSGRLMMVDINNSTSLPQDDEEALALSHSMDLTQFKTLELAKSSSGQYLSKSWEQYYEGLLVDPIEYFQEHFAGRSIFRYVQTHPDMDHMSGLFRFFWQENVGLENFWDTDHKKTHVEGDFEHSPFEWANWLVYGLLRGGVGPDESSHKVLRVYRESTGDFWTADNVEILSPTPDLVATCNEKGDSNNLSYVLRISHGGRSLVLPGDAEKTAWDSVLDHYGSDLSCDILKASHHGRRSGYHHDAVSAMDPSIVICSVGKKPTTDASSEYAAHGASVLSTRYHGCITATMWHDGEVWVDDRSGKRIASLPIL